MARQHRAPGLGGVKLSVSRERSLIKRGHPGELVLLWEGITGVNRRNGEFADNGCVGLARRAQTCLDRRFRGSTVPHSGLRKHFCFDLHEPVFAEEHLIAHKEGRNAECATRDGGVRIRDKPLFHRRFLRLRQ